MNNFLKNYRVIVGVGLVSLSLAATIDFGINKTMNDSRNVLATEAVNLPSAGITCVFNNATWNTGNDTQKTDELSAGIASVLNNYYDVKYLKDVKTPNKKGLENVVSMLSANGDVSQEQPQAETPIQVQADIPMEEPQVQDNKVASILPEYTVLGVANVTNYLNVRQDPNLDGKILGKLPMNAGCEIIEETNGWYKVKSGELEGFVAGEFLLTGEAANQRATEAINTVAFVKADKLMVREQPNTNCSILTKVAENEELEVIEELDGWVKVNINNITGYVSGDYVQVYDTLPKGVTLKQLSYGGGVSSTAVDLIEYAKQFLGNRYVWGGTSLTNGTDCSGFTMRIFEHFGYSLSRTSGAQSNNGTRVSLSELQPGDLIFYNHGSRIGHVAIYIGNRQIIHASTERTGIIIGNAFYTTPACATRIIR